MCIHIFFARLPARSPTAASGEQLWRSLARARPGASLLRKSLSFRTGGQMLSGQCGGLEWVSASSSGQLVCNALKAKVYSTHHLTCINIHSHFSYVLHFAQVQSESQSLRSENVPLLISLSNNYI